MHEELVSKLNHITRNDFSMIYRTISGTESVEIAVQIGLHEKSGWGVLFFRQGYHGNSIFLNGMIEAPEKINTFQTKLYKKKTFSVGLDIPHDRNGTLNSQKLLVEIEKLFSSKMISIFLLEPYVSFSAWIKLWSPFLERVRELCDKYGVILIFDEVVTWFGRLWTWFGYQLYDVVPDMLCAAKWFTSGYTQWWFVMTRGMDNTTYSYYATFAWAGNMPKITMKNIEILEKTIETNNKNQVPRQWKEIYKKILGNEYHVDGEWYLYFIRTPKDFDMILMQRYLQKNAYIVWLLNENTIVMSFSITLEIQEWQKIIWNFKKILDSYFSDDDI